MLAYYRPQSSPLGAAGACPCGDGHGRSRSCSV